MPMLTGDARREAAVTLSLLLQEQGRWEESIEALGMHTDVPTSRVGKLLAAIALLYTTRQSQQEMQELMSSALDEVVAVETGDELLAAARLGAEISNKLRDPALCELLSTGIAQRRLEICTNAGIQNQVTLAQIKLLYFSGSRADQFVALKDLEAKAHSQSTPNSLSVSINAGLGTMLNGRGRYAEAANYFRISFDLARRLDSAAAMHACLSNLALCHSRLGETSQVVTIARRADKLTASGFLGYSEILIGYHWGLALVAHGEAKEVDALIQRLRVRMMCGSPDWMAQAWDFFLADLLFARGEETAARNLGWNALDARGGVLCRSFAGMAARIATWNLETAERAARARAHIRECSLHPQVLDANDLVEVLCAQLRVARADGDWDLSELIRKQLNDACDALPPPALQQMELLGAVLH